MSEIKMKNLNYFDVEELACKISGLDYEEIDGDTDTIATAFFEKFNFEIDEFTEVLKHLMPMIDVGKSELTGKTYKGFANIKQGCWILKVEVEK